MNIGKKLKLIHFNKFINKQKKLHIQNIQNMYR